MIGVIKKLQDRLMSRLLEDECEELRLRCASLDLELRLKSGLEERNQDLEQILTDLLEIFADGREAMSSEHQATLLRARRVLSEH